MGTVPELRRHLVRPGSGAAPVPGALKCAEIPKLLRRKVTLSQNAPTLCLLQSLCFQAFRLLKMSESILCTNQPVLLSIPHTRAEPNTQLRHLPPTPVRTEYPPA